MESAGDKGIFENIRNDFNKNIHEIEMKNGHSWYAGYDSFADGLRALGESSGATTTALADEASSMAINSENTYLAYGVGLTTEFGAQAVNLFAEDVPNTVANLFDTRTEWISQTNVGGVDIAIPGSKAIAAVEVAAAVVPIAGKGIKSTRNIIKSAKNTKYIDNVIQPFTRIFKTSGRVCFVAGTKVITNKGNKNIEDIKIGDLVLSQRENQDYKKVKNLFTTHPDSLVHLIYEVDGIENKLIGTRTHRFFSQGKWVEMQDLKKGDILEVSDGSEALVVNLYIEFAKEGKNFTTYNFEVEDYHNYFVSPINSNITKGILVHNDGILCKGAKARIAAKLKSQPQYKIGRLRESLKEAAAVNVRKKGGSVADVSRAKVQVSKELDDLVKQVKNSKNYKGQKAYEVASSSKITRTTGERLQERLGGFNRYWRPSENIPVSINKIDAYAEVIPAEYSLRARHYLSLGNEEQARLAIDQGMRAVSGR